MTPCVPKLQGGVQNMKWRNDKMALWVNFKRQWGIPMSVIIKGEPLQLLKANCLVSTIKANVSAV